MKKFITIAFLAVLINGKAFAQSQHAFYDDVQTIKKYNDYPLFGSAGIPRFFKGGKD